MSINSVQNYENRNNLSNIIRSTLVGGVIGYGAKYAIPLKDREKKDINYRAIINASRKDVNMNKANSFVTLKSMTPAQDEFVKLIKDKEPVKNPTLNMLAERLGGETTELGKKVLAEIKEGMTLEQLSENLGKASEDRRIFTSAFADKEAFAKLSSQEIITKLGGKEAPVAQKVAKILEENAGKPIVFDNIADALGKSSKEVTELKRVSKITNAFAEENLGIIIRRLGGEKSQAGEEFRRIIKEVNKNASDDSRAILRACHKALKDKRYASPLIIAGAAAGFTAAFIHNVLSHKTEA